MRFNELMEFHPQNKRNFDRIKNAYSENTLVPFVGAGLGIPPYKGWGNALESICSVVPNALPELKRLLLANEYELAASHVFSALKVARFNVAFYEEFSPNKITEQGLSAAMQLLPEIFPGLVFTTNYDRCLETSYNIKGRVFNAVYSIRDKKGYQDVIDQMLRGQPHSLFKIHGDIDNLSGRVLLNEEYNELYDENGPFAQLLSQFFYHKCFLFIGCSMTGNDRYMHVLKQVAAKHTIPNYAILPKLERKANEEEALYQARIDKWESLLSEHWILPVFYPAGDYASVLELLKALDTTQHNTLEKSVVHHTGFYGRKTLVEEIQKRLMAERYLLVHGEGGIGKTQVCEEVVSRFNGKAIKIYLQGARDYLSLLRSMQHSFGLPMTMSETDVNQMKQAVLEKIRSLSTNNPFLIYLDNFEDVLLQKSSLNTAQDELSEVDEGNDPSVDFIIELVNGMTEQCFLLISSRDLLTGFPSKKVDPLDDSSMLMLFQKVFQQAGGQPEQLDREEDSLTELIRHLSGLPLAAVLSASQVTVSKSVKRILELWHVAGNPRVLVAIDQNPTHVALQTALLVSYKHLGENHDAKLLWGYLALVSQDLPDELAIFLLPSTYFKAEERLIMLSLAERNRQNNGLSMLEPIKRQAFSYDHNIETECINKLSEVYRSLIVECHGDQSKWYLAIESSDDILYFLHYLADRKKPFSNNLLKEMLHDGIGLANLLERRPRTGLAFIEKIYADRNFIDSLTDEEKAYLYEERADCQYFITLHADAMENYNNAQQLYETLGMKKRAADCMCSKGELEYWDNRYPEAERLYLDAKKIFEEIDCTSGIAVALMKLGVLYCELENKEHKQDEKGEERAFIFLNQARELAEQGNDKETLANIYYYIGEYYSKRSDYEDDALKYYQNALELYDKERDSLGKGNVYQSIGDWYFSRNPQLALRNYRQAVVSFGENEIPEKYYSRVTRKIELLNRRVEISGFEEAFDIEKLIANIDRKIAVLEAEEVLEHNADYNSRLSALVLYCAVGRTANEMISFLGLSSREYFRKRYLNPLLQSGRIMMTIPDKPRTKHQKYVRK